MKYEYNLSNKRILRIFILRVSPPKKLLQADMVQIFFFDLWTHYIFFINLDSSGVFGINMVSWVLHVWVWWAPDLEGSEKKNFFFFWSFGLILIVWVPVILPCWYYGLKSIGLADKSKNIEIMMSGQNHFSLISLSVQVHVVYF